MAAIRKFLFDTSFDFAPPTARAESQPLPSEEPEVPQEEEQEELERPSYLEADLLRAREEGYAQGLAEGRDAALRDSAQTREEAVAQLLSAIARDLEGLSRTVDERCREGAAEAIAAALSVLRKLFPDFARRQGLQEAEALMAECLANLHDEPRIVLRLPDSLLDDVTRRIDSIQSRTGFEGKVVILADESLGPADVRVEWADGGAERDCARLWSEVEDILRRTAAGGDAAAMTSDETTEQQTPPDAEPSGLDLERNNGAETTHG